MYENGKMRSVETIMKSVGEKRRMVEGMNSTVIYYKNFYKYHNVPPVQQ
jgi:hypothetical protein